MSPYFLSREIIIVINQGLLVTITNAVFYVKCLKGPLFELRQKIFDIIYKGEVFLPQKHVPDNPYLNPKP